ncbi:MAG: hypothetical protein KatS3mg127_0838 [Silanimonas sp.]|nr:MAG: hypothetical protein KatS3mg127_0838 [Silanimonas sp.]
MPARALRALLGATALLLAPMPSEAWAATGSGVPPQEGVSAPPGFDAGAPLTRIAFGSCAKEHKPQPIWSAVEAADPQLFLFLGDNLYGELSRLDVNVPYPLVDLTSSGLTEAWHVPVPNALRLGRAHHVANFGLVEIDWERAELRLSLRDAAGRSLLEHRLALAELAPLPAEAGAGQGAQSASMSSR